MNEQVTTHIQQLDPAIQATVEAIRQVILSTDPEIGEHIKWNNPSFYYTGAMKPFAPKEYKAESCSFFRAEPGLLTHPGCLKETTRMGDACLL
jgi:hypothetical protein